MTTDTIEKPTKKPHSKKQKAYFERLSKLKTKIDPLKVTNLLSSGKLSLTDAGKLLGVTGQAVGQALKRYNINVSEFDLDAIKNNHESELHIINSICRGRIFDKLFNEEKLGLIELTATLDRSFQQLRELQGKGHSSINIFTLIVQKADEQVLNITPTSTMSSTDTSENQQVVHQAPTSTRD